MAERTDLRCCVQAVGVQIDCRNCLRGSVSATRTMHALLAAATCSPVFTCICTSVCVGGASVEATRRSTAIAALCVFCWRCSVVVPIAISKSAVDRRTHHHVEEEEGQPRPCIVQAGVRLGLTAPDFKP